VRLIRRHIDTLPGEALRLLAAFFVFIVPSAIRRALFVNLYGEGCYGEF